MSIYHSAKLVYGVCLTSDEIKEVKKNPNWDEIYDEWAIVADAYSEDSDLIIGSVKDKVGAGEATELSFLMPSMAEAKGLFEVLEVLGIYRNPTWHLVCEVS